MLRAVPSRTFLASKQHVTVVKAERIKSAVGLLSLVSPRSPYPADFGTGLSAKGRHRWPRPRYALTRRLPTTGS